MTLQELRKKNKITLTALAATQEPEAEPEQTRKEEMTIRAGRQRWSFGEKCLYQLEIQDKNGAIQIITKPLALKVWPIEMFHRIENDEYGVRYRYITRDGQERYATLPASSYVDVRAASQASAQAARRGVQIYPKTKSLFAMGLGHWSAQSRERMIKLVRTPGWHKEKQLYVNGNTIFGGKDWFADEMHPAIVRRSARQGDVEAWTTRFSELFCTPGLLATLGLSLAGPLVGKLDMISFGFHLHGHSSFGKSTAARLAASVWGAPSAMMQSWDCTLRALEGLADVADGGCMVLDELKRFRGDEESLSAAIHGLCSVQGRSRLLQNGALAHQRQWQNTILSTGEVSIRDSLGNRFQGGHRVRMIDVEIGNGDLTKDAEHAKALDAFYHAHHGVLSDAWLFVLLSIKKEQIEQKLIELPLPQSSNNEEQRMHQNLRLAGVALLLAEDAKLLPITRNDVDAVFQWLLEATRYSEDSMDEDPMHRALKQFVMWLQTQPSRFPHVHNSTSARDVIGYRLAKNKDTRMFDVYTTEGMLKAAGLTKKTGVNGRSWCQWLLEQGIAVKSRKHLPNGLRQRWIVLEMEQVWEWFGER